MLATAMPELATAGIAAHGASHRACILLMSPSVWQQQTCTGRCPFSPQPGLLAKSPNRGAIICSARCGLTWCGGKKKLWRRSVPKSLPPRHTCTMYKQRGSFLKASRKPCPQNVAMNGIKGYGAALWNRRVPVHSGFRNRFSQNDFRSDLSPIPQP